MSLVDARSSSSVSTKFISRLGLITCEGCLVVITGHGPQAEVAQVFGHELLVEREVGRLEGLEGEQQKGEEKETGEENNHHTTHR